MHETSELYIKVVRLAVEDVLGARNIALDKPLEALGGTSLDAIELIMLLEERLEVQLPDDILSLDATVSSIAAALAQELPAAETPPVLRA